MTLITLPALDATLRRLAAVTVAAATVVLAGPPLPASAGIPAGTFTEIEGTVPITGLTGTWRFSVFASDGGPGQGVLSLGVRKRNAARTAWADQSWLAIGGEVSCASKLASCTIEDQDELGTFGTLQATFTPTGPLRTTQLRCEDSDVTFGTRRTRKGVLTGSVRLRTGSDLIGTIRNGSGAHRVSKSIVVTASRTTFDPVACPITPESCGPEARLIMDGYLVGAVRPLPTGRARIGLARRLGSSQPGVARSQSVTIDGPGTMLSLATKQSLAGASLDLSRGAPFLSGTLTYAGAGLQDTTQLGCAAKETEGTVTYDLVLRMPGRGAVDLADTTPGALYRIVPS